MTEEKTMEMHLTSILATTKKDIIWEFIKQKSLRALSRTL